MEEEAETILPGLAEMALEATEEMDINTIRI
jgi:hypothetical protein